MKRHRRLSMFRYCNISVCKGCHSHNHIYSHPLHHFWSSHREIKRKHQTFKQFLIIPIATRLFVNHCASTFHETYIHFHRSRPRESIQLSSGRIFLTLNKGDFDKESTTQRSNSRAPGVNLSVWQSNNFKSEMLQPSR